MLSSPELLEVPIVLIFLMKSSFERFRLYHIDQSLRIRFQDLAGNDLGLRAGNYTVEHGFRLLRIHSRRRNFRCTVMHRYHDFLIDLIRQLRHDKQGDLVMFLIKQMYPTYGNDTPATLSDLHGTEK